jgi:hypothetical protein
MLRGEANREKTMSQHTQSNDWEIAIICQMGGASGSAAGIFFADVRSVKAMTRAPFIFIGGGFGFGGSMGGGGGPSPADVVRNHVPDMYTKIPNVGGVRWSVDNLDCASGKIVSLGAAFAYGYSLVRISAGMLPPLFESVPCSGWGTGVGANGSVLVGMWKQLGDCGQYGDDLVSMLDDVDYNSDELTQYA